MFNGTYIIHHASDDGLKLIGRYAGKQFTIIDGPIKGATVSETTLEAYGYTTYERLTGPTFAC